MKVEATTYKAVPQTATITFDRAELEFLKTVMQRIGGNPTGTRGHAERLDELLTDLGMTYAHVKTTEAYAALRLDGSLYFLD